MTPLTDNLKVTCSPFCGSRRILMSPVPRSVAHGEFKYHMFPAAFHPAAFHPWNVSPHSASPQTCDFSAPHPTTLHHQRVSSQSVSPQRASPWNALAWSAPPRRVLPQSISHSERFTWKRFASGTFTPERVTPAPWTSERLSQQRFTSRALPTTCKTNSPCRTSHLETFFQEIPRAFHAETVHPAMGMERPARLQGRLGRSKSVAGANQTHWRQWRWCANRGRSKRDALGTM